MKSKVLERAMFASENKPDKISSGIMQGFDDEEPIDMEENNDDMIDEISRRSPRSPEILMNNLRGDMRSVDARYQELAEMVGEEAAMETPPEVLAMLQSQLLAQQAPMGIGALPAQGMTPPPPSLGGAPMPTSPEMSGMPPMPPQMPQEPMPMDQGSMPPPQGFAYGGSVSNLPGYGSMNLMDSNSNSMNMMGSNLNMMSSNPNMMGSNPNMMGSNPNLNMMGSNPNGMGSNPNPNPNGMNPYQGFAKGGIASLPQAGANFNLGVNYSGPVEPGANYIQGAGRNGDSMVAHMTPEQHQVLSMMGGGSTTNPKTGLPEHYMGAGMATNLMQRIQPYAQAANQMIGNRMAPVLTPPSIQQSRTTLGTFGPKTVEGMELTYPSLTQRIGTVTQPIRNYVANMPASQKAVGALSTIPGGAAILNAMGGGENVPNMPTGDIPSVIGTDKEENRIYSSPPAAAAAIKEEVKTSPVAVKDEKKDSVVGTSTNPPTGPKTVDQLITQQKGSKKNRLKEYMQENLPVFEEYMAGDKEATQAQALFLLADAGLEFATKPARTGMLALANAFKRLPAGFSQLAAEEQSRKTQVKGAALTSALQSLAAEDKTEGLIRKVLAEAAAKDMSDSRKRTPTDRGAGLTSYTDANGNDLGFVLNPTVVNSFLNSRLTPQAVKDKEGTIVGFNNPYVRVLPSSQTMNTDKTTRENLFRDLGGLDSAINSVQNTLKDVQNAFGPGAFFADLKNNVLVPVLPLNPDLVAAEAKTKVQSALIRASKAIAGAGDSGNIAVAEQKIAMESLGDKPSTFFSSPEVSLKKLLAVNTSLINQKFIIANQLGFINQDVIFDTPNLGTKTDPIPQDKLSYLSQLASQNPKGQVYISTPSGVQQVLLSTFKQ